MKDFVKWVFMIEGAYFLIVLILLQFIKSTIFSSIHCIFISVLLFGFAGVIDAIDKIKKK